MAAKGTQEFCLYLGLLQVGSAALCLAWSYAGFLLPLARPVWTTEE